VLDVSRNTLAGTTTAGQWVGDLLSLWVNAGALLLKVDAGDSGLAFDCDEVAEAVGPHHVAGQLPDDAPNEGGIKGLEQVVPFDPGGYQVRVMVREEEPGILTVTLVDLAEVVPNGDGTSSPLPAGTYQGTIPYAGQCSIVRSVSPKAA